jgi:hypothetical protein
MLNIRSFNHFILISLALLSLSVSPVNAAIVHQSTCATATSFNCITGIDGLVVGGTTYDMTVLTGQFNTLFPSPGTQLLSWGDYTFGGLADDAIAGSLNAVVPTPTSANTKFTDGLPVSGYETLLHLPSVFSVDKSEFSGRCLSIQTYGAFAGSCSNFPADIDLVFAQFTPASAVPVPAAVWLFGTALIGFIGISRRTKVA